MPDRVVAVCLDTLISVECYDDTTDEMIYKLAREKLKRWMLDGFGDVLDFEIVDEWEED